MLKINQSNVTIMVKNMDRTIDFYKNIGLNLKQRWDNHYAMMQAPELTLGIHPSETEISNLNSFVSFGFMVDDINDAKKVLEANNIVYKENDGKSGHYLHFNDPDGYFLYFTQPKW